MLLQKIMINLQKRPIEFRNGYKDPKRLERLRQMACIVCERLGLSQTTRTEAHHLKGYGMGKKVSDLLTFPLCGLHHARGNMGEAIHETPLKQWETVFGTQERLLELTNEKLLQNESF